MFWRKKRNEKFLENWRRGIYFLVLSYLVSHEWNQTEAILSQVNANWYRGSFVVPRWAAISFVLPFSPETLPVCPNRPRHTFPTLAGINNDAAANETDCGQIKPRLTTHLGHLPLHLLLPFRFQRCFAVVC